MATTNNKNVIQRDNTPVPQKDAEVTLKSGSIPAPIVNVPAPVVNVPAPIVNVPEAIVNVPAPVVNVPPAEVNVPEPVVNIPAPIVNVPAPIVNVPAPVVNVPAPIVNMAARLPYKHVAMAAGNSTPVKVRDNGGAIGLLHLYNNSLVGTWIKLYDKAGTSAPNPATDTPFLMFYVGPNAGYTMPGVLPEFTNGLWYVLSSGFSVLGIVSIASNAVLVNIGSL